jgi:hypothetical protein
MFGMVDGVPSPRLERLDTVESSFDRGTAAGRMEATVRRSVGDRATSTWNLHRELSPKPMPTEASGPCLAANGDIPWRRLDE